MLENLATGNTDENFLFKAGGLLVTEEAPSTFKAWQCKLLGRDVQVGIRNELACLKDELQVMFGARR